MSTRLSSICEEHTAQVLAIQPMSMPRVVIACARIMMNDPVFSKACGYDREAGTLADSKLIGPMLVKMGPPCCFIGADRFDEVVCTVTVPASRA